MSIALIVSTLLGLGVISVGVARALIKRFRRKAGTGGDIPEDPYEDLFEELEQEGLEPVDEGSSGEAGDRHDGEFIRRERLVRDILNSNDLLASELLKRTGHAGVGKYTALKNEEVLAAIVRATYADYPHMLDILHVASTQTDINFSEISSKDAEAANLTVSEYPTDRLDYRPIESLDELPLVSPEDLVQDDELAELRLLQGDLMVVEYYRPKEKTQRILVTIVDASGSMEELLRDLPRHVWARGVLINLLLTALEEDVRYVVRYFTDTPSERIFVNSEDDAREMIAEVVKHGYAAGSTSIKKALRAAVKDIAELRQTISGAADILLISDGEDSLETRDLTRIIPKDVNLHVACIALTNNVLKKRAKTYYEIQ